MKIISQYVETALNAGPKAKKDIEKILVNEFNAKTYVLKLTGKETKGFLNKMIYKIRKLIFSLKYINGTELTIIQFPFNNQTRFTDKCKNKVAFIHDLEGIRRNDKKLLEKEINSLKSYNYVIAHNNKMKEFLIKSGIEKEKIFVLQIFDYLNDYEEKESSNYDANEVEIAYTGNLSKSRFIQELQEEKMVYKLFLYGKGFKDNNNEKLIYKGMYKPDELPNKIEGKLGLVWDGSVDEQDEDITYKNYLRYNNPHKFSCYIAANLPVIVWEQSAIAKFVKENNIGYTIKNLYEINNIDYTDYEIKKANVKELGEKIRKGYFTKKVINEIMKCEKNK